MKTSKLKSFILLVVLLSITIDKVAGQSAQIWKERERLPFIKDSIELINTMNYVGILYQAKNIDSCFYFGVKAKGLSIKLGYTKGEIDADNLIGVALNLRGLFKEAMEMYSNVLTRYRQQGDTENVVQVLMNLALVYGHVGDTVQSRKYFHQAMAAGRNLKRDSVMSLLYVNYSATTSLSEDSVRYYLGKSRQIAKKYKYDWIPVFIMQVEGEQRIRDHSKDALPFLEETLSKASHLNMELFEINSLVLLANYYKNDPNTALKYYHQAYDLAVSTGNKILLIPIVTSILEFTRLTGNVKAINNCYELLQVVLKKENENLRNFIGDYVKYSSIQEDNKLLEITNSSQQTKIWMLITILIISALLVAFVYWQYRVSRHLNQKISEQNSSLQKTLTALEESQEENTRMMKIVAHDLRNPISAIKMAASLVVRKSTDHDDDKKMLDIILRSADNSLELVNDLLSTQTKLEDINKGPIDMQVMLQYCADLLKHKAMAKRQHIDLITIPITLSGSREKLWRVISNLIANAIKFSPNGATIQVKMEKDEQKVRIAVNDHGIGIPEEMKSKIFDMFTEAKRPGTAGEQPFGLGLAISKQIVEAHGGRIWFESTPTSGTTFWVELPDN